MYVQMIIAVLVVFFEGVCTDECVQVAKKPCKCVSKSDRYTVDLSSIVQNLPATGSPPRFKQVDPKINTYEYSYSPCKNFTESICKDVAVCQSVKITSAAAVTYNYYYLGTQSSAVMSGDAEKDTLKITYWSANSADKLNRTANVNVKCSDAQEPTFEVLGEQPPLSRHYYFNLHTHLACVALQQSPAGGLSAGSVLLIVCAVLVAVYLVGGVLYMRFYGGARGIEQIPNVEFWKDFPSLVKDGMKFTMNGCQADSAYSQI